MAFCQRFCNWVCQPPLQLRGVGIYSPGCKQGCFQPPPGQSAAAPRPWRGLQHQILQALYQVVGDVDLAAPFHLVPRHLRPQADDWRVRGAEGQALRHPQPGPEHDSHGHPHRVDRVCGYQRRGLLRSEVVGGFWGFLAMPPPIRGDCSNQSARRGRPGAMSPESAGGLGSWLVSGQSRQDARAASIDAVNRWIDGWVQGEEVIWWRGRFWRKDGCVWCPESDHFFRKGRKDGTFPRSLPHCAGCWSPARDEGASGSSSRYCGYSSIFRLGRSTPRFGMPTGDSCRPTGSA